MIAEHRILTRPRLALLLIIAAGMAAFSCTLIGQGQLHVSNDESGIGANNTILRAYAHNPGDTWPAEGEIGVLVQGDDFGTPPSYGLNGTLLLVNTAAQCPMSEGAPETFTMAEVAVVGDVPVIDGSVNQAFRLADTVSARAPRWALIEPVEMADFPGEHRIHRCGTVTWVEAGAAVIDPCVLRSSLEGNALAPGVSFALGLAKWQICNGGAAAGSNEKFLFFTIDGGASWDADQPHNAGESTARGRRRRAAQRQRRDGAVLPGSGQGVAGTQQPRPQPAAVHRRRPQLAGGRRTGPGVGRARHLDLFLVGDRRHLHDAGRDVHDGRWRCDVGDAAVGATGQPGSCAIGV